MSDELSRREFVRRLGATGLAVAGAGAAAWKLFDSRQGDRYFRDVLDADAVTLPSFAVDRPASAVTMAIARGSDPDGLVRAALGAMGGIEQFVQRGDVVLLKPNVAFDRPAALGATTHPDIFKAVARACRDAGAERILVADNPINQPEGCFFKSGITAAAEEMGAELILPRKSAFHPLKIDGDVLTTWPMFTEPFEVANKVIGIAPLKDHNLCSASMTMKNWYGLLGGRRNQFHQRIHGIVSDFPHMIKPTLVLLDATRMLMRNGPTGGSLGDVARGDTLIAGTDMVAVDTFGYGLLGRDPAELEYLHLAEARGLGSTQWKQQVWREVNG
ncbi:MAG: DUF362 domain-containing protein [Gemmatimonadetes bacterium]|jgi:uncharacterized protein (DUF362 family)|nr:DUF362 domain-containing protein [Gemmatimonadota bacterium]MBT6147974.1 DUF362 domain-containing protein [Gemmatimonadota bacterium]MBT7864159.1 DUF362 domain-containing protein [Gemmatimonadota bacterium]